MTLRLKENSQKVDQIVQLYPFILSVGEYHPLQQGHWHVLHVSLHFAVLLWISGGATEVLCKLNMLALQKDPLVMLFILKILFLCLL